MELLIVSFNCVFFSMNLMEIIKTNLIDIFTIDNDDDAIDINNKQTNKQKPNT